MCGLHDMKSVKGFSRVKLQEIQKMRCNEQSIASIVENHMFLNLIFWSRWSSNVGNLSGNDWKFQSESNRMKILS